MKDIKKVRSTYELNKLKLSAREKEVLKVVVLGESHKSAGEILKISERTVKFHLTNIYKKTGQRSKSKLILWYNGL